MKEVPDKCNFCDKHLTVERLKNEKAEMTNSRERLYQEYLVLQSQLTEKDKHIEELKKQINWKEKALAKLKKGNEQKIHRVTKDKKRLIRRNTELKAQIEKMKSDIEQLRENRMNDDTDQNIIDRLWKEWDVLLGVSN